MQTHPTDEDLIALLRQGSEEAVELIFRRYYAYLCRAVYKIVPDAGFTEDLVQEVFYELWRKRDAILITVSLKAYLRRAAVNKALNHIRDQHIRFAEEEQAPPQHSKEAGALQQLAAEELQAGIDQAIDALPGRCRIAFVLSRFEDMSYREIAELMGTSTKTVEHQIAKALRLIREALGGNL